MVEWSVTVHVLCSLHYSLNGLEGDCDCLSHYTTCISHHTVHSQLLTTTSLHTNSHKYCTNIFSHAFFLHTFDTNKHKLYCINHSQPFTSADVHMA